MAQQTFSITINPAAGPFPLAIHSSQRYLVTAGGQPFFIHGDTPWSLVAQLTDAQITQYLNDRAARGFNAVLLNAPEKYFTSQTPSYRNASGFDPFTSMTNWVLNNSYWNRVDHAINTALALSLVCIVNPCYFGWGGGSEGWHAEVSAASTTAMQDYGTALGARYQQPNIIWCAGGDYEGSQAARDKQAATMAAIKAANPNALFTAHAFDTDPAPFWGSYSWFSLNNAYMWNGFVYSHAGTAYNRTPIRPAFLFEAAYEAERTPTVTAQQLRRQSYTALASGMCGQMFGNSPIWHFGSSRATWQGSGTWQTNLNSTGAQQQQIFKAFVNSIAWHTLVPKTDNSFVTTSLGSGDSRIVAAKGPTLGIVSTIGGGFTINMATFPSPNIRGRWFNTVDGTYTTASGSPFVNSGTRAFSPPGERVLVLDYS